MHYSRAINAVDSLSSAISRMVGREDPDRVARSHRTPLMTRQFTIMEDNRTDHGDTSEAAIAADESPIELQQQRDEYYDRLLRKTAEFDNYRKRIERERQSVVGGGRRRPDRRSSCRSSTISSARSRPTPAPKAPRPIAAASS